MPNHIHGIIAIIDSVGVRHAEPLPKYKLFGKPKIGSIPTIIRSFKSVITKRINEQRHTPGLPVWQRNYYEHIIRDEKSFNEIADYITNNPARWETDELFFCKNTLKSTGVLLGKHPSGVKDDKWFLKMRFKSSFNPTYQLLLLIPIAALRRILLSLP